MNVELSISLALGAETAQALDSRLLACLLAVKEGGSLAAASHTLGVSYRHLWGLLEAWERQCGASLVHLQRGRGARLTPLGQTLLAGQQHIDQQLAPELLRLGTELAGQLNTVLADSQPQALKMVASHDLSLERLRDLLGRKTAMAVELSTRGSLDSLSMLATGQCDIAGFHFSAPLYATTHLAQMRSLLDANRHCLMRLVTRRQGLLLAQGNPLRLHSLADVASRRAHFINRQPGSGTRLLVDVLLEQAEIGRDNIVGYENEEFTHLAVAAMVASSAADAGFGIEAAARQFKLDFEPVTTEQYWLALDTRRLNEKLMDTLSAILRGPKFQQQIEQLVGYNGDGAGECVSIGEVFSLPSLATEQ